MSKRIKLSNGEAEILDFISARVYGEYQDIVRSGMSATSSYELTKEEEAELKTLPLAERIKIKKSLAPTVDISVIKKGQQYLVSQLLKTLIIEDKAVDWTEETLLNLNADDYDLISQECYSVLQAEKTKSDAKKK